MTISHDDAIQALSSMTVSELLDLTRALERHLGISAVPLPPVQPLPERRAVPAYGCPPSPTRVSSRLELVHPGPNKPYVLIFLRGVIPELAALPLAELKRIVEKGPMKIPNNIHGIPDAMDVHDELHELGATVRRITEVIPFDDPLAVLPPRTPFPARRG